MVHSRLHPGACARAWRCKRESSDADCVPDVDADTALDADRVLDAEADTGADRVPDAGSEAEADVAPIERIRRRRRHGWLDGQ